MRRKKRNPNRIELQEDQDLQSILDLLKEKGITDLSKVLVKMDYSYNDCCDGEDIYYASLAEPAYDNIRLEWKNK